MSSFNLKAVLGFDGRGFEMGMAKADATVKKFGSGALGVLKGQIAGAFAVGVATAGIKSISDQAGKVADLADRWNISTDAVQQFQHAFDETGASVEEFEKGIKALAVTRLDALKDDSGEAAKAFRALGITGEELKSLRLEDLFLRIADGVEAANDPQDAMVQIMKLLGGKSSTLFPAMRAGLRGLTEDATRLGLVMKEHVVKRLDDMGDAWERNMKRIRASVGDALGAALGLVDDVDAFSQIYALAAERVNQRNNGGGPLADMSDKEWQDHFDKETRRIVFGAQQRKKAKIEPDLTAEALAAELEDATKAIGRENAKAFEMERENRLKTLSIQERRLELEKELAAVLDKQNKNDRAKEVFGTAGDPAEAAKNRVKAAQLRSELIALPKDKSDPIHRNQIQSDSLLKVGNFLGNGGGSISNIQVRQLERLSSIDKTLYKIHAAVSRTAMGGGGMFNDLNSSIPATV